MAQEAKDKLRLPTLANAEGYEMWKFRLQMALMKKDCWDVVESATELQGASAATRKKVQFAMGMIVETVDDTHVYMIKGCPNAHAMWETLETHYEQKTPASRLFIKRKISKHRMKQGESLNENITRLMALVEQLASRGAPMPEEDQIAALLDSLPSEYSQVVNNLEDKEEGTLTMATVKARLQQAELKMQERAKEQDEEKGYSALVSKQVKTEERPKEDIIEKEFCCMTMSRGSGQKHHGHSQTGHRGRTRGQIHSYRGRPSPNHKQYQNSQSSHQTCWSCGQVGHYSRGCARNLRGARGCGVARSNAARVHTSLEPSDSEIQPQIFRASVMRSQITHQNKPQKPEMIENEWYLDSGATHHMKCSNAGFQTYDVLSPPKQVKVADGRLLEAVGRGSVGVVMSNGNKRIDSVLTGVLHVPDLEQNLFSANACTDKGKVILLDRDTCMVHHGREIVAVGCKDTNGMYLLNCQTKLQAAQAATVRINGQSEVQLWHQRYGHLHVSALRNMQKQGLVSGMQFEPGAILQPCICSGCAKGKMHRLPFPKTGTRAKRPLDLVHSDLCGPMQTKSLGGARYFLTFIDDATRYCTVYFLKNKSETISKFVEFEAEARARFNRGITVLRTDKGGEYDSKEFVKFCKEKGIVHQVTVAYTPQQNGVAERKNRTIVESARSMLYGAEMTLGFWAEAVATAVYVRNRALTSAVRGKTPFQAWFGTVPNVSHLRVFGCLAYVHVPKEKRQKLDPKAERCRMIGYSLKSKCWRFWNPASHKVIESRDAVFDESFVSECEKTQLKVENQTETKEKSPMVRRSARIQEKEQRWNEKEVLDQIIACAVTGHTQDHPKTLAEALKRPDANKWKEAAEDEYNSLLENKTWRLVDLPKNRQVVSCRWVFTVKHKADGSIERYKARLVARGFSQQYGEDFQETYSPVVNFTSVRTLLALAAQERMHVHQMDVTTAFLNGDLDGFEIYMEQPEGFVESGKEHLVCQLDRSLYGLKQAPRCWNQKLDGFLLKDGFTKSEADACIYQKKFGSDEVLVAVYVDDLIIATSNLDLMAQTKKSLGARFKMKDMGKIGFYLGLQIAQSEDRRKIFVTQSKYVQEILKKFGQSQCNPSPIPMNTTSILKKHEANEGSSTVDRTLYQSAVGSLLFASLATRPDIAAAVGVVCRFNANPNQCHWNAVKKIFAYLKGTSNYGILFQQEITFKLKVFADTNWAGDLDDRKSTTGYVVQLAGGPISWSSRKQPTVALSTAEAEYMALSSATQETIWLRSLLGGLGKGSENPTVIFQDNQACIFMAKNPVIHARSKHIDIRHHFVREKIAQNEVSVQYCPSAEMCADLLTKPLPKVKYQELCKAVGVAHKQFFGFQGS